MEAKRDARPFTLTQLHPSPEPVVRGVNVNLCVCNNSTSSFSTRPRHTIHAQMRVAVLALLALPSVDCIYGPAARREGVIVADAKSFKAEVLDAEGRVSEGFSKGDARPTTQSDGLSEVRWSTARIGSLRPAVVQLRFTLQGRAKLYSFQIRSSTSNGDAPPQRSSSKRNSPPASKTTSETPPKWFCCREGAPCKA